MPINFAYSFLNMNISTILREKGIFSYRFKLKSQNHKKFFKVLQELSSVWLLVPSHVSDHFTLTWGLLFLQFELVWFGYIWFDLVEFGWVCYVLIWLDMGLFELELI